ncbi:MAG: nucleotidyltransferase family protein [Phycisphaeraceae bacterium]|nr:nucleotidyltransferase family protein [Phycisphaeraceae bacterium]
MLDWRQACIPLKSSILEAIAIIDRAAMGLGLVVDPHHRLHGTITDGDVRRGLLRGVGMDQPVAEIMNPMPIVAEQDENRDVVMTRMREKSIRHMPVVDGLGRLIDVWLLDQLARTAGPDNWVVLMAGGQGMRLRPLTEDLPKPLLAVGERPILQTILEGLIDAGFRRFFFSVNYKAEMIESIFGNGENWGVEIQYLRECEPLGTAGSLRLLPETPTRPLLVMNADLLTRVDYVKLLDFHTLHKAAATMCVRGYDLEVPYGVVRTDEHHLVGIEEKPRRQFLVNAGIYVLNPDVLELIPSGGHMDMTALFEQVRETGRPATVFPIREYWMDIGRMDDFQQANQDYPHIFKARLPNPNEPKFDAA